MFSFSKQELIFSDRQLNIDHFDSPLIDLTWVWIQGNLEIYVAFPLAHGASKISLESLEYLSRCVFLGKPWLPSFAKLMKALLSFLASLQHLLSGFPWILVHVAQDSSYSGRSESHSMLCSFIFIWIPQFWLPWYSRILVFDFSGQWEWHEGWDAALLASIPCAGNQQVLQGEMWGPSQCGPLLYGLLDTLSVPASSWVFFLC